jgi:hypothetical protein
MLFNGRDEQESLLVKSFLMQECIKRGYLFYGCHNMSWAHTDEICAQVIAIYEEVMPLLAEARAAGDLLARMEGRPITPIFKRV